MSLREWLITKLGGYTKCSREDYGTDKYAAGFAVGKQQARIEFAVLPLPFTPDQLAGKEYGTFITPAGFGHIFGECNVPAPGPYGYSQIAGYISKSAATSVGFHVDTAVAEDDRDYYVPVIVTVLR